MASVDLGEPSWLPGLRCEGFRIDVRDTWEEDLHDDGPDSELFSSHTLGFGTRHTLTQ